MILSVKKNCPEQFNPIFYRGQRLDMSDLAPHNLALNIHENAGIVGSIFRISASGR